MVGEGQSWLPLSLAGSAVPIYPQGRGLMGVGGRGPQVDSNVAIRCRLRSPSSGELTWGQSLPWVLQGTLPLGTSLLYLPDWAVASLCPWMIIYFLNL